MHQLLFMPLFHTTSCVYYCLFSAATVTHIALCLLLVGLLLVRMEMLKTMSCGYFLNLLLVQKKSLSYLFFFLVLGCPLLSGRSWWILLVSFSSSLLWCPTPGAKAQDHLLHSQVSDRRGSSGNFCFPSPVQCLSETCSMLFHSHLPFLTSATSFQWGPSCWSVSSPHRKAQLHSCILKKQGLHYFCKSV